MCGAEALVYNVGRLTEKDHMLAPRFFMEQSGGLTDGGRRRPQGAFTENRKG